MMLETSWPDLFFGDGSLLTSINANGSVWIKIGDNLYPANLDSNVGIGTTTPLYDLQIGDGTTLTILTSTINI